ncbi:hypothetical protein MYC81_000521 [Neisseria gonorrhoeae]|uniref:Uncharacterized protein n=6 Tax=Neisseria gonorrhoeae TaxID=485 RepID=Q5F6H2_NEIG1|nr:hypothetical protein [Neisseria gonorrhoeae]KLR97002.1 hypothetical protein M674_13240 [Neisseria gonorrhoeae SK708]KLR98657.1 hypothetical protein M683_09810 [Neisseria gonorrhoeae SK14515]KLS38797.1 hypothetical protein M689_13045 [Neisseria gonorrhoeae SK23020]AAW90215.1 hypothetical protein NGO_1586 [Neisseria gonorrhoeae FA 1090]ACF30525.1 Conserved hypothetical protein [Neisseria gonorrhoeae NCCP11945]
MGNGHQNNQSSLEKRIFYLEHSGQYLMICALSDYSQNKHTVVMANFLYPNEKMDWRNLDDLFNELVLEELQSSFMDWYPTIEKAISHHLEDFS